MSLWEVIVVYIFMLAGSFFLFAILWSHVLPHKEPKEEPAPMYMVS